MGPSSRYVITAVTQPMKDELGGIKYQMEAGYAIWTFQGRQLHKVQKEKLYHINWRRHPPSLLTPPQQQNIRKNLKQFSRKYDAMDEQAKESARMAFKKDRESRTSAFLEILDRIAEYKEDKEEEIAWPEDARKMQADYWEKVETRLRKSLNVLR